MLDQTMRTKQEGNIGTGNRKSALKRGEGKFWEDRKQTLTAATFKQKDHIIKKQKTNKKTLIDVYRGV